MSFVALESYEVERESDALVLRSPSHRHHTFVVRSVSKAEWNRDDQDAVVDATSTWLAGLPEAEVEGPTRSTLGSMSGYEFKLSFAPRTMQGRYERRHIVLFGTERVFHVLQTAPATQRAETSSDFEALVESLVEEG